MKREHIPLHDGTGFIRIEIDDVFVDAFGVLGGPLLRPLDDSI